jgi:hypothetical protein
VAGYADRIVRLRDGNILSDMPTDQDPVHRAWAERVAAGIGASSIAPVKPAAPASPHAGTPNGSGSATPFPSHSAGVASGNGTAIKPLIGPGDEGANPIIQTRPTSQIEVAAEGHP